MGYSIIEEAKAVETGFWPLYRYNPAKIQLGENPLTVDYYKPGTDLPEFLDGEDRFADLVEIVPQEAKLLRSELQDECNKLFDTLNEIKEEK